MGPAGREKAVPPVSMEQESIHLDSRGRAANVSRSGNLLLTIEQTHFVRLVVENGAHVAYGYRAVPPCGLASQVSVRPSLGYGNSEADAIEDLYLELELCWGIDEGGRLRVQGMPSETMPAVSFSILDCEHLLAKCTMGNPSAIRFASRALWKAKRLAARARREQAEAVMGLVETNLARCQAALDCSRWMYCSRCACFDPKNIACNKETGGWHRAITLCTQRGRRELLDAHTPHPEENDTWKEFLAL